MYSTAKDVHVGIASKLYQINTNRKGTFRPEEIDEAFNNTMLKFIEERSIINMGKTGLTETVKRNDDLKDLQVLRKLIHIYLVTPSQPVIPLDYKVFCELPVDYYKFESLELGINYDCKRVLTDVDYSEALVAIYALPFATPATASEYDTFDISYSGNTLYNTAEHGIQGLSNVQSKFIIVNSVLQALNRDKYNTVVYWEDYGDIHVDNTFLFVYKHTPSPTPVLTLTVGATTVDNTNVDVTYSYFADGAEAYEITNVVPTDLVAPKYLDDARDNYYMYKNRYRKPFIEFETNTLRIDFNPHYIPARGYLSYVKRPIMLNLKEGIMTNFKSHIEEVIDLTVTNLSLVLTGNVEATASISTKNIQ